MWCVNHKNDFICGPHLYKLLHHTIEWLLDGNEEYCYLLHVNWYAFDDKYIPSGHRFNVALKMIKMIAGPASFESHSTTESLLHFLLMDALYALYEMRIDMEIDMDDDEQTVVALYNDIVRCINEIRDQCDDIKEYLSLRSMDDAISEDDFRDLLSVLETEVFVDLDFTLVDRVNNSFGLSASYFGIDKEYFKRLPNIRKQFVESEDRVILYWMTESYESSPIRRLQYLEKRIAARKILRFMTNKFGNADALRVHLWRPLGPMSIKGWNECHSLQLDSPAVDSIISPNGTSEMGNF